MPKEGHLKNKCIFIIIFTLISQIATSNGADLFEVLNSTCKIHNGEGSGTGTVYHIDDENIYILSCGHITRDKKLIAQFYINGKASKWTNCETTWIKWDGWDGAHYNDLSLVRMKKPDFKPSIVKIADKSVTTKKDDVVFTYGCADGGWPTLVQGHVVDVRDKIILFHPSPKEGRSGSALLNKDLEIIGVLVWQGIEYDDKTICGEAISLKYMYESEMPWMGRIIEN